MPENRQGITWNNTINPQLSRLKWGIPMSRVKMRYPDTYASWGGQLWVIIEPIITQ